ncbi:MAG TPA: hypothetical protein VFF73_09770, partial [Planctomycetota bacterium]|nr:hypothetical protein [Planctomycetota bacterium]
ETIGRIELERIRPYITVDSPHEGEAWTDPQPVNHVVRYEPYQPFCIMQVQDGRRFRNGMIVKIQPIAPPGANTSVPYGGIPEYRKVVGVHQQPDHWAISVFPQLERDYDASTIELSGMLPRPVNLNAAPKEVLVALLTGLQTRLFQKASAAGTVPPDFVTPTAAAAIADKILANPLKCHQDLAGLLAKAVAESTITAGNGEAILQCAVDPANKFLSHAGVPMVYTSGDVYEITATGIVNDEAANEVARVKTREIVQVAPPRDLVWVLDSQQDFQDRVGNLDGLTIKNDPRSLSPAYFRGIWTNLVETFPQDVFAAPWLFPQRAHEKSSSPPTEVKLAMSRDWDQPAAKPAGNGQGFQPGVTLAAHYDNERSGHQNKNDVQIPAANLQLRTWVMEDGTTRRVFMGPGTARAWFRTDQLGGPKMACFFDAGVDDNRDRMTCGYDLETHELVATIHDESLDMLETGGKPRPSCEVRYAVPLRQEQQNWYHVAFAWKGSERGDLALCLDGKPVGTDRTGTKTTAQIDANTLSIPVESTANFPPKGFIRVGGFRHPDGILAGDVYTYQWSTPPWSIGQFYGEVLYYESKTDTAFNIAQEQNPWAQAWLQRHQAQPGQPQPTPPEGSDTATRVPHRSTGRFSEEPDPGFLPLPVRRGSAHETGTPVYLWGYTLWLKNGPNWSTRSQGNPAVSLPPKLPQYSETLHQGKAELIEALPQNTPCTFVYKPNPPGWNAQTNPRPVVVQPQDNEVPVVWAAPYPDAGTVIGGWPAQGVIRIGNERMFYTSIIQDKDAPKFVVQRGLDGTTPQAHRLWETVVLESIHVSPNQDYATRNNLIDPEVFVQLTPPQTPATLAATLDPRTPCSVEWVSILTAAPPLSPQFMIMPAVRGDGAGRGQSLLPNPEAPRFIALPQQPIPGQPGLPGQPGPPGKPPLPAPNPPGQPAPPGQGAQPGGPVDVPLRGDNRWIAAMEQEFTNLKGRLPPNAGNAPIVVPPPPPPKPGAKIAGPPPLPGATKPLKEWLKMMDGNHSRAQKATSQQPIWSQTNPQATTVLGGRPHQPAEKVIPTFVIGATHTNDVRDIHFCGKGDTITLADDTELPREEHTIVWRAETDAGTNAGQNGPSLTGDSGTGVLLALDDFTQRVYKGADHARIVRFPSGQMPHGPPPMMVGAPGVKSPVGGAVQGMIDELIVTAEPEPSTFEDQLRSYGGAKGTGWPVVPFLDIGASTYDTCLQPNNGLTQYLRGGVIFKLEDEILGVNDVSAGTLGQGLHVVRGMLGTTAASHGNEASFWWNFPFPRLAVAEYGFSLPKGDQISLRPRSAGPLHDHDFVVGLDRGQGAGIVELLPIRQQRGNFLLRPRDRWDRGTFRAQFGSGLAQPDPGPGDILFDWPFRYQDRYQARVSSLEGVFVEATKEVKGAYFQSITWDASLQNNFQKVLVAVRVDGAPAWDSEPAKADEIGIPGKLYLFDDPKKENKILVRGDRVEVRVYMTLKPGAFYQDGWKQTPILHAVKLTYRQPTRVRRREEMLE